MFYIDGKKKIERLAFDWKRETYDIPIEYSNKAINLNSYNSEGYLLRGAIYYKNKEYKKALKDFETALSKQPSLKEALNNKCNLLYNFLNIKGASNSKGFNYCNRNLYNRIQVIVMVMERVRTGINGLDELIEVVFRRVLVFLSRVLPELVRVFLQFNFLSLEQ